jgi:hypothetical protein
MLDDYVEAQVHGGVVLGADVAAVVVDPSFRRTRFEELLRSVAADFRWGPGFRLPATEFPAELRGPEVPPLALEVAERYGTPVLTAEVIGRAAREPGNTADRLQLIKYLWHILVLRGSA